MPDARGRVGRSWRNVARTIVPRPIRVCLLEIRSKRRRAREKRPWDMGALRRTTQVSTWGADRGGSIDRVYIERFLERHRADIRGRVLEVQDDNYARRFGVGVEQVEILDARPGNPKATVVADLTDAPELASGTFDCVILTQTLFLVYDVRAALRTVHRILVPGGVLLATVPGISKISPLEAEIYGDWWRFTSYSARRLAEEAFGEGNVDVETYGNVLSAAAFLFGLGTWDLSPGELDVHDPLYEVTIAARGVKRR